jgi:hypothetical protein
MIKEIYNALGPCLKDCCSFVEITSEGVHSVFWCRYCGRLEVYEQGPNGNMQRSVNLNPKITKIVKEYLND